MKSKSTIKKKPEKLLTLITDLPMAGVGKTYSKKEWKRIFGYEVGLVPGVKFVDLQSND